MTELSDPATQRQCLNCGEPLQADFCAYCGQQEKEVKRPFIHFLQELVRVLLELDGRAYRTVFYLLTRPGFLTLEYFAGRRIKYTPPLRLFLVISIGFYLSISLFNTVRSMQLALEEAAGNPVTQTEELDPQPTLTIEDDEDSDADDEGDSGISLEEIIAIADSLELPLVSAETNRNLQVALRAQLQSNIEEITADPEDFLAGSLEYITFFMLLMMPILALIQQILWVLSKRYYVEHLVLTVHNHAFLLLMVLIFLLVGLVQDAGIPYLGELAGWLQVASVLWIFVYLYLSLKRYFQAGWIVTTILFFAASSIYTTVISSGMLAFAMVLVLLA